MAHQDVASFFYSNGTYSAQTMGAKQSIPTAKPPRAHSGAPSVELTVTSGKSASGGGAPAPPKLTPAPGLNLPPSKGKALAPPSLHPQHPVSLSKAKAPAAAASSSVAAAPPSRRGSDDSDVVVLD